MCLSITNYACNLTFVKIIAFKVSTWSHVYMSLFIKIDECPQTQEDKDLVIRSAVAVRLQWGCSRVQWGCSGVEVRLKCDCSAVTVQLQCNCTTTLFFCSISVTVVEMLLQLK